MDTQNLIFPAHYSAVVEDDLVYLDGGKLSDLQAKLLLGSASILVASIMLVPNVFEFMLSPILTPITDAIGDIFSPITGYIKDIFS